MTDNSKISYLVDNRQGRTLEAAFKRIPDYRFKDAMIAVGYFHVSGFNKIRENLKDIPKIRLVIGNETDHPTKDQLSKGHKDLISKRLAVDLDSMSDEDGSELETLAKWIENEKLEVRVYTKTKFHAKAYVFNGDGMLSHAIVGSSNMSVRGLGFGDESNTELNIIEQNTSPINEIRNWFDQVWEESEKYSDNLIQIIRSSKPIIKNREKDEEFVSPRELFQMIACEYDNFLKPEKGMLTDFQLVGSIAAGYSLDRFGGCIIADSVGLGKTYIGISLLENAQRNGSNVLLMVPKALESNWKQELRKFKMIDMSESKLKIMTHTKMSNKNLDNPIDRVELDNIKSKYDFIVIDEAHRLKSRGLFDHEKSKYSGTKLYANISYIRKIKTKMVLLTATPLNNSVMDLAHQIELFTTDGRLKKFNATLNMSSFNDYTKLAKQIQDLKKDLNNATDQLHMSELKEKITEKEAKSQSKLENISAIINEIMILRTKKSIIKDYPDSRVNGKKIVSEIPKVIKEGYEPGEAYDGFYDAIQDLIVNLSIPHITLIRHGSSAIPLSGLFRILLFKRLESSIRSFIVSLDRLVDKETAFKNDIMQSGDWKSVVASARDHNLEDIENDIELDALADEVDGSEGSSDSGELSNDDVIRMIDGDLEMISRFKDEHLGPIVKDSSITDDPKIEKLAKILEKLKEEKVLIFTQYVDTALYVKDRLKEAFADRNTDHIIGGLSYKSDEGGLGVDDKIKRFAPVANNFVVPDGEDIDILVSTDTLSEGVNLQDCHIIINYDLPWNPMRIVQRVGRIDRIGSTARALVYNIIPNEELEAFLALIKKLDNKIENITKIIGKEFYILSEDEDINPMTIGKEMKRIRLGEKFELYENGAEKGKLQFHTNESHSKMILMLRKKMEENLLSCSGSEKSHDIKIEHTPYTIIKADMGKHAFVLFKIYDKNNGEKIENVMIAKDIITGEYSKIKPSDPKIIDMLESGPGMTMKKANTFDFVNHVDGIIANFESEHFNNIRKQWLSSNLLLNEGMQEKRSQNIVVTKLRQIKNNKQQTLSNIMTEKVFKTVDKCLEKLQQHTLKDADASKLNKWYEETGALIDDISRMTDLDFINKTNDYLKQYVTESNGYTNPRKEEDVKFSIICRGGII